MVLSLSVCHLNELDRHFVSVGTLLRSPDSELIARRPGRHGAVVAVHPSFCSAAEAVSESALDSRPVFSLICWWPPGFALLLSIRRLISFLISTIQYFRPARFQAT